MNQVIGIRKYIIAGIIALTTLCTIWFLFSFSWVQIIVPDDAEVTIRENNKNTTKSTSIHKGSVSMLYKTGEYVIKAASSEGATEEIISVKPLLFNSTTLTITDKKTYSVISNGKIDSIHETPEGYYFIDTTSHRLIFTQQNGEMKQVFDNDIKVYQMYWNNTTGMGLGVRNGSTVLCVIKNNTTEIIPLSGEGSPSMAVDTINNTWWVARGQTLYKSNKDLSSLEQVASSKEIEGLLISAYGHTAVFMSAPEEGEAKLIAYNASKKTTKYLPFKKPSGVLGNASFSWSEDGSYALYTDQDGTYILDNTLSAASIHLPKKVTAARFLQSSIIYGDDHYIWKYDIKTKKSQLVADIPAFNKVSSIEVDKNNYYYRVYNSGGYLWYRTMNSPDDKNIITLAESNTQYFPDNCNLYFTHFTKTTLVIQTDSTKIATCQNDINNYLDMMYINSSEMVRSINPSF